MKSEEEFWRERCRMLKDVIDVLGRRVAELEAEKANVMAMFPASNMKRNEIRS